MSEGFHRGEGAPCGSPLAMGRAQSVKLPGRLVAQHPRGITCPKPDPASLAAPSSRAPLGLCQLWPLHLLRLRWLHRAR